jgi:hypothetical protein
VKPKPKPTLKPATGKSKFFQFSVNLIGKLSPWLISDDNPKSGDPDGENLVEKRRACEANKRAMVDYTGPRSLAQGPEFDEETEKRLMSKYSADIERQRILNPDPARQPACMDQPCDAE